MENKTSIKVFLALMLAVLMPVVSCINVSNAVLSDGISMSLKTVSIKVPRFIPTMSAK